MLDRIFLIYFFANAILKYTRSLTRFNFKKHLEVTKKMKQKNRYILSLIPLLLSLSLCACNATGSFLQDDPSQTEAKDTEDLTYEEQIRLLEDKIIELQQSQYISDAEHQEELKKLQKQLAELKGSSSPSTDSSSDSGAQTDSPSTDTDSDSLFLYKKEGTNAIITGYRGTEAHIVIPSSIDGYSVISIGDSAFSSATVKSVIISSGIQKIDWFAFSGCSALISVTIPASVTSIGYAAFAPQSSDFTIYCHSDSFAHKYAKSYGWSYSLI